MRASMPDMFVCRGRMRDARSTTLHIKHARPSSVLVSQTRFRIGTQEKDKGEASRWLGSKDLSCRPVEAVQVQPSVRGSRRASVSLINASHCDNPSLHSGWRRGRFALRSYIVSCSSRNWSHVGPSPPFVLATPRGAGPTAQHTVAL